MNNKPLSKLSQAELITLVKAQRKELNDMIITNDILAGGNTRLSEVCGKMRKDIDHSLSTAEEKDKAYRLLQNDNHDMLEVAHRLIRVINRNTR